MTTTSGTTGAARLRESPHVQPARPAWRATSPCPLASTCAAISRLFGPQFAGPANVIMQLSWPGVGYGVMNSRVHDGSAMLHPIKRARTTFTYLAVAMLGTDEDRTAFRKAVNGQHAQVVSTDDEPVTLPRHGPAAADLGRGLPLLRHPRHDREDARPAAATPRLTRSTPTAPGFGTTLQMPAEGWPVDRAAFDEYWERVAGRGAHRPAGARLPAAR